MRKFLVGGAVRDQLLGRPVVDRDWVVVGATPEEMLAAGFKQVGADFPVFLDASGEEHALARVERKSGAGYHGFEVRFGADVTLKDDLRRRDLTVNAMAQDETGQLVDPFGGAADLQAQVLRPVSDAFREDPVRVLRAFRFLARFGDSWSVHPVIGEWSTAMLADGEFAALPRERFLLEVEKALGEPSWWLFFNAAPVREVFAEVFGVDMPRVSQGDRLRVLSQVPQFFQLLDALGASNALVREFLVARLVVNSQSSTRMSRAALGKLLADVRRNRNLLNQVQQLDPALARELEKALSLRFADFDRFGADPVSVRKEMEAAQMNRLIDWKENL
jgi:tRNA nucleotidyltransferase/poly(A) polymerase